ncbi:hypothetical protein COP2_044547 [Malus domestica]
MGRSPCCEKAHTNKGAWTKEEDDRLIAYIRAHGEGCWRSLPKAAGLLRCGKSCRLRWINYLRPDLNRGNFTEKEDELIIKLHSLQRSVYRAHKLYSLLHLFSILNRYLSRSCTVRALLFHGRPPKPSSISQSPYQMRTTSRPHSSAAASASRLSLSSHLLSIYD